MHGGEALRSIRERLGLTLRDVEAAAARLAERYSNPEYSFPISRISDVETKAVLPSLFRLYSLAVVYGLDVRELLSVFGIEVGNMAADRDVVAVPRTHRVSALIEEQVRVPLALDPSFDLRTTSNLSRMVSAWGIVPFATLQQFESDNFTYGYIGTEDFTMYPLLLPGSFIRVDNTKRKVMEGFWRSEYERPMYFLETRSGYVCSWCEMSGDRITLRPHPLSPVKSRSLLHDREVDVVGQVVGIAMRLGQFTPPNNRKHVEPGMDRSS